MLMIIKISHDLSYTFNAFMHNCRTYSYMYIYRHKKLSTGTPSYSTIGYMHRNIANFSAYKLFYSLALEGVHKRPTVASILC